MTLFDWIDAQIRYQMIIVCCQRASDKTQLQRSRETAQLFFMGAEIQEPDDSDSERFLPGSQYLFDGLHGF